MLKVFDVADMLLATSDVQLVRLCRLNSFLSSHFRKAYHRKKAAASHKRVDSKYGKNERARDATKYGSYTLSSRGFLDRLPPLSNLSQKSIKFKTTLVYFLCYRK